MLKWKFKFKVNPDCTRDPGTWVPARELHTRPGYINTRILPGLVPISLELSEFSSNLNFDIRVAFEFFKKILSLKIILSQT